MWHPVKYPKGFFFFFLKKKSKRERRGEEGEREREREHMPEGRGGPEGGARERREGIPGRLYTQGSA